MIRNYNSLRKGRDAGLKIEKSIDAGSPLGLSIVIRNSWLLGLFVMFCMFFTGLSASAQVSVTATAGTVGPTAYTTVKGAFDAINAGTHQGDVIIEIQANTTEGTTPATLNSNGAGSALYTSVLLRPGADGVSISGNPASGFGVIQLKGADNVTIDGDNPGTGGTNRNLTINNTASTTTTYGSCIRIANAATVTSSDNNTVRNCILNGNVTGGNASGITSTTGSSNASFGIIVSGNGGATATDAPTAVTSVTGAITASTTVNNFVATNNAINQVARGVAFQGNATAQSNGVTITNNLIGNATSGATAQVFSMGIQASGSTLVTITGNTIYVESFLATASQGINIGTVSVNVSGVTIANNKILRSWNNNPATYGAYGINIAGGSGHTIQNNFVANVKNDQVAGSGAFDTTFGVHGIRIGSGTGHKVYNNSVHLSGAIGGSLSTDLTSAFSIVGTGQTGCDVRNNIFSNQLTGGNPTSPNTKHAAIYLPSGATSAMNLTLNNNAMYQGSAGTLSLLAQVGTTGGVGEYLAADFNAGATSPATNLRAYTSTLSAAGTNDNASLASATSPFASATDLHLIGSSGAIDVGATIATITTDIDGEARPNGSAYDIGADEYYASPGTLQFGSATYSVNEGNTLTVTVTRAGGTAGVIGATYTLTNGTATGGASCGAGVDYVNTSGTVSLGNNVTSATFTVAICSDGGLADPAETFTIALSAPTGGTSIASPASTTVTITDVPLPLSGTYTVGSGGNYPSLTNVGGIFEALNLSGAVGNVTINVISDLTGETGTNPLNQIAGGFTVLIKPSASPRSITGSSAAALIKLNGADFVTINGSFNGTSSKDLTIQNTSTATTAAVVWLAAVDATNGATNNAIRNCIIKGDTGTTTFVSIVSSGVAMGSVAESANSNNTYTNNSISASYYGLALVGPTGGETGTVVSNNSIGSTVAASKIGFRGIAVFQQTGVSITGNSVIGVTTATTATASGIAIQGTQSGGIVANNIISDIKNTNAGGYGANGIGLYSSSTTGNVTVYNNMIDNVTGLGYAPLNGDPDNGNGIMVNSGGGYNIYYNTVSMNVNQVNAGNSQALNISTAVTGLNVRNNIFSNTQTNGTRYAVYNVATVGAAVFTAINYNDYDAPIVGYQGSAQTTLANWQAATTQDAFSVAIAPVFVSSSDLHLNPTANNSLDNLGTAIAGITTDIDNAARSASTPDMGADEFTGTGCTGAVGGTAVGSVSSCGPATNPVITASGYSTGTGSTYQWMSSSSSSNYPGSGTAVSGQTIPTSLAAGTVSSTTYYWLRVTCTTGLATAYSNMITVTVTPIPAMPTVLCYQTATLNTSTCSWDVTGTPPAPPSGGQYALLSEAFDDVTTLGPNGWSQVNTSTPIGSVPNWGQGGTPFVAQTGGATAYVAVNYNSVAGANTISNWLISPQRILQNGDVVKFWSRTVDTPGFPDRLQVRLSTTGAGTNPNAPEDLGSYTTLLTEINPTQTLAGYPNTWTEYTATISGLAGPTSCRVGFRYYVTGGGPSGSNSDYIGVDTFSVVRPIAELGCGGQSYVLNTSNCTYSITGSCSSLVNLKLYLEGYYTGSGTMRPVNLNQGVGASTTDVETITVELHNSTAPYALAATTTTMLKTNGVAACTFTTGPTGNYYIVVKTRNAIDTWSAGALPVGATPLDYDFSSDSSQAFGDNMKDLGGSVWGFYSGDIDPSHDGNIDTIDYPIWETDSNNFASGPYATDLNGDGNVDTIDYPIWETNSNNFVSVIKP